MISKGLCELHNPISVSAKLQIEIGNNGAEGMSRRGELIQFLVKYEKVQVTRYDDIRLTVKAIWLYYFECTFANLWLQHLTDPVTKCTKCTKSGRIR